MLSYEDKLAVITSFPELARKDVSLGRVNFQYEESRSDKKNVVYHLHPNGNGYVYAGQLSGMETDERGYVNIRNYSEAALRSLITASIASLSGDADGKPVRSEPEQIWIAPDGAKLRLIFEEDMWYIYAGLNLEMAFETLEESVEYLHEEGCVLQN